MPTETRTFEHSMLREIYEQPEALRRTLAEYVSHGELKADRFQQARQVLARHKDLVIAASGSSRHAGLAAELMFEDTAGLTVDVEYASEYISRSTHTRRQPAVLVLSQSGETADTLAALREAKARGLQTLAITNVVDSSMAREADVSLPTLAGRERAIPATKSFTTQLLLLRLLSLAAAQGTSMLHAGEIEERVRGCLALPDKLDRQLAGWEQAARELTARFADAKTLLYLGRGIHYAIAREGALKLKEASYVHAEGYPAGELKHGPNALVSNEVPLLVVATVDWNDSESVVRYEKTVSLLEDLRRQGARLGVVGNTADARLAAITSDLISVEPDDEYLLPILEVVPLQMFSYFMALEHGVDVDRPRNLVKAVVRE